MAKDRETLCGLFAPPRDDLHGVGGILCAYSGDAEFLEECLARFSRVPAPSRISRGSVDWTLMLDPLHPVLQPGEVAGLQQLRPRPAAQRPWEFHRMHAKVALLAFGPSRTGEATCYRLLVSTGNWTRESACHQLELAWFLDIDDRTASEPDRHELWAIAGFLRNLMRCYQTGGALTAVPERMLGRAQTQALKPKTVAELRFMGTLPFDGSAPPGGLLSQVRARLGPKPSRFNTVVCGSGFFERTRDPAEQPQVLKEMGQQLAEHLVQAPQKRIVANASGDDQVIASFRAGALNDWKVHHPADPVANEEAARERLHAKFLFLARRRGDSYSTARLYLGSGNLSIRGFLLGARARGLPQEQNGGRPRFGNVEAGVLLRASEIGNERQLGRALPIGPEFTNKELAAIVPIAPEDDPLDVEAPPAPILAFVARAGRQMGVTWDETVDSPDGVQVMPPGAAPLLLTALQCSFEHCFHEVPRSLEIRWGAHRCRVPCLNENGEFPRQTQTYPHFGAWLDQLRGFPETWDDPAADADEGNGDEDTAVEITRDPAALVQGERDFPARMAMLLVEAIAEQNGAVSEDRSADWLHSLRHLLIEEKPAAQLVAWRALRVNFLRPLLSAQAFAPEWSNIDAYVSLIEEVATAWQIDRNVPLELGP